MKGVLVKDLYIARSNILVTLVSLVVLGFGLSFLLETSALLVLAPVAATTAVFISITSTGCRRMTVCTPKRFMGKLPAVTFRGHLLVILCKKAEECGYEKDLAGRG